MSALDYPSSASVANKILPVDWVIKREKPVYAVVRTDNLLIQTVSQPRLMELGRYLERDLNEVLGDYYPKERITQLAHTHDGRSKAGDLFIGCLVYQIIDTNEFPMGKNIEPIGWVVNGYSKFLGKSEFFSWGPMLKEAKLRQSAVIAISAVINDLFLEIIKMGMKVNKYHDNPEGEECTGIVATCPEERLETDGKKLRLLGFKLLSPEELKGVMKDWLLKEPSPKVGTKVIEGQPYGMYRDPHLNGERFLFHRPTPQAQQGGRL